MVIVHLCASPFFGGPERQMLGLARTLREPDRSVFLSFPERGLCRPFLDQLRSHDIEAIELRHNMPRLAAAAREVASHLRRLQADVLCCHGYKPDLVGLAAARLARVPVVSVSRGWTAATAKVRLYEKLDRLSLRCMERVVCVSAAQADKVRAAGVRADRVLVIRNAINPDRFARPDPGYRDQLHQLFPTPPQQIILAAGRLSPEKGFAQLIAAGHAVTREHPSAAFTIFGEGPLRPALEQQICALSLVGRVLLPGFRGDIDRLIPCADLVVLPSLTEGLPNVALEAAAAGVPIVATAVGGTPEVIQDGVTGNLVPPDDPAALANRILHCLQRPAATHALAQRARQYVRDHFTFEAQADQYHRLFTDLLSSHESPTGAPRCTGNPASGPPPSSSPTLTFSTPS